MADVPVVPLVPLATTKGLKQGDVLQVAVRLLDRQTREPYWWRRHVVILDVHAARVATVMTLRPDIDLTRDVRDLAFTDPDSVVMLVPQDKWPQGVAAMWMKYTATGLIKLDGG